MGCGKMLTDTVKYLNKKPLLLVAVLAVLLVLYQRKRVTEGFRSLMDFNDPELCTQGTPCGLTNGTVNTHRNKVEEGAVEFTGPNEPGYYKKATSYLTPEPFNQETELV